MIFKRKKKFKIKKTLWDRLWVRRSVKFLFRKIKVKKGTWKYRAAIWLLDFLGCPKHGYGQTITDELFETIMEKIAQEEDELCLQHLRKITIE